jgi:hypothetical protein
MKPAIPKLKQLLVSAGVTVTDVRYLGPGKKLCAIGFDAQNALGTIEVEPKGRRQYFVSFDPVTPKIHNEFVYEFPSCMHYSIRKYGFQPSLTKPLSTLKPDLLKFFNIKQ